MTEAAGIAEMFKGVSYERLEGWRSLQWPVKEDGSDTPMLYTERFKSEDGLATLYPLEWKPPAEAPDEEYDLSLDNGRLLEHFQATNQTGKSPGIVHEVPHWFVEVSPELARERGIEDGTWVRVRSRRGCIDVRAVVTDRVRGNTLYLPIHHAKPAANALTGDHHDPDVNTPGYKEVAVKLEVLAKRPDAPALPHNNSRYGHRTPNGGPHVEDKWARPDYTKPPEHQLHPETM
jgi:formate dehydrogenase major subunit